MLRSARNILRLIVIARTLAQHDALFPLAWLPATGGLVALARLLNLFRVDPGVRDRRPGERLALALEALGPSFIKAGQALSTRSDLVGGDLLADLTSLQDRLPPFSGAEARAVVEAELGRPIDALFASFEAEATAAASIAQVHFATVTIDTDAIDDPAGSSASPDSTAPTTIAVAVKILRPGVEKAFERDLDLLRWPNSRRISPTTPPMSFPASTGSVRHGAS